INSKDRDAIFNLAKAYNEIAWNAFKAGNMDDAVRYWKKTLKVNPSNKAAKYYIHQYE
ncbi:MAG: tetratricopeptide repeat protein, partial [Deltaproteobacteria bacterium]|nr:tetratricopeptide repeat protein [Deltaproteobacteria bacterium]